MVSAQTWPLLPWPLAHQGLFQNLIPLWTQPPLSTLKHSLSLGLPVEYLGTYMGFGPSPLMLSLYPEGHSLMTYTLDFPPCHFGTLSPPRITGWVLRDLYGFWPIPASVLLVAWGVIRFLPPPSPSPFSIPIHLSRLTSHLGIFVTDQSPVFQSHFSIVLDLSSRHHPPFPPLFLPPLGGVFCVCSFTPTFVHKFSNLGFYLYVKP